MDVKQTKRNVYKINVYNLEFKTTWINKTWSFTMYVKLAKINST